MKKVVLLFLLFFVQSKLLCHDDIYDEKCFLDTYTPLHDTITARYHNILKNVDNTLCTNKDLNNTHLEKIIYKNRLEIITSFKQEKGETLTPSLYIRANIILPKPINDLNLLSTNKLSLNS